jgi:hypothetical protein
MRHRNWLLGSVAAALVVVPAALGVADVFVQVVRGRATAVDTTSGARGDWRMVVSDVNGQTDETLVFKGVRLGATPDAQGHLPAYHVVLVNAGGTTTADFGAARISRGGAAGLRFDSKHDSYPAGVTTLTAFGGGTFELQLNSAAVLRGTIPAFAGVSGTSSKDSFSLYHATSSLTPTASGGAARGTISAEAADGPVRSFQRLRIAVKLLGTTANPFTVVAIDASNVVTTLGTITTHGHNGEGVLSFDTRHGDTLPGGGLSGLSGQTIEVRNNANVAVISGKFPTVP